ncbi:hypothetical protein FKW77_006692 [Venturia effusa]|uniref:Post-GPI attachment to proteins factor 3 n=1 Tax=Venturia effusa TaxID=50376 RepID=A0A517LN21_9PEZI|nr:hypothetical protein FKW77_006692 [Venturia effusa]
MRGLEVLLTSLLTYRIFASANNPTDWTSRNPPSALTKWTTDPDHAFWSHLFKRSSPHKFEERETTTPHPTPTKCTYVPENTAESCPKGCICKTQCAGIFFANLTKPVDERSQYHVCTNWMLNHASQLRYGFQRAGFTLLDRPPKCGWQRLSGVSELRVGRGSVDVNGTVAENWGNARELDVIRGVMEREYPFVEILLICAMTIGPIFSFLGLGIWGHWASGWGKRDRHS